MNNFDTVREALKLATDGPIVDRDGMIAQALAALTQLEAMVGEQEPVAWQILNGVCYAGIRSSEALAKEAAAGMQKNHDLGGSLAAFHVRPLYAAPVAQQYEAGDMASAAAQGFRDGVASVTQQEPVAWAMPKGDGTFIDVITPAEHARDEGSYTVPLFAHPVAQQPQAIPRGWTIVPIKLTEEMLRAPDYRRLVAASAGETERRYLGRQRDWEAMLIEAPKPPTQQPQAKPHKPLFADLIAQHPGLREELKAMDKQPQAEAVPSDVVRDADLALDLLAKLFDAYENGPACYEDPNEHAGFLGNAVQLDDGTFHACADLLNRRRPIAAQGAKT